MKHLLNKAKILSIISLQFMKNLLGTLFVIMLMKLTDCLSIGNYSIFINTLVFTVGVIIVQFGITTLYSKIKNYYIAQSMIVIRSKVMDNILRKNYESFYKQPKSQYQSFLINDIDMFENSYFRTLIEMGNSIISIVFSCIAVLYIKPSFLVIILVLIPASLVLPKVFSKKIGKCNEQFTFRNEILLAKTEEYLSGFEIIKSHNIFSEIREKYESVVSNREGSACTLQNYLYIGNNTMASISIFSVLILYGIAGYFVMQGQITIGSLIALVQLTNNLINPTSEILAGLNEINSVRNIKEKLFYILDSTCQIIKRIDVSKEDGIKIKNLSFNYSDANGVLKKVLHDIDLTFESGKKYALVGSNGCGKSTLLKILTGRIRDYQGEITLGSDKLNDLSDEMIDSRISYLSQDLFLFDSSIDDNLSLFQKYSKDDVISLATQLKITHLLEKDIQTHAPLLSGGEKQKLSIARSLLQNKNIIIWDEAETSLDIQSKKALYDLICSLENVTFIAVTHSEDNLLQNFDELFSLREGVMNRINNIYENCDEYVKNSA